MSGHGRPIMIAKHQQSKPRNATCRAEQRALSPHSTMLHTISNQVQCQLNAPVVNEHGGSLPQSLANNIQSKRGIGRELPETQLDALEGFFGSPLDNVRIHDDLEAGNLAASLGANAFTIGNDIFFSHQASPADTKLLTHELTHVIQQRQMPGSIGDLEVGPADDPMEQQADQVASDAANAVSTATSFT